MAVDVYLKKIEALLTPGPDDAPTGFITAEDLKEAFGLALMAIDETYAVHEEEVVGTLLHRAGKAQVPTYQVVDDLRNVLAKWSATIDSSSVAASAKGKSGLFGTVTGEAVPSSVAQTVQLLNNLIRALAEVGLVRDGRAGVTAPGAPTQTPPTGITAPTAPSTVWTFAPANATLPADLAALKGDTNVGDAALVAAGQGAFSADQFIILADGSRATFDSAAWSQWFPARTGLARPRPGSKEWTFAPTGSAPVADFANLQADTVVGDTALNNLVGTVDAVDFTSGEFIKLADNSEAFFAATPGAGATGYSWQVGRAP